MSEQPFSSGGVQLLPRYINPFQDTYTTYNDRLKVFNYSLQERVAKLLEPISAPTSPLAFTTTGSDGRLEKGPQSRIELLILKRDNSPGKDIIHSVQDMVSHPTLNDIFGQIEVKDIEHDILSYFKGDPSKVYPTRIFDARFLNGDRNIIREAFDKVYTEVRSPYGYRIREHVRNSRRRARQITESGLNRFGGQTIRHYDLENGVAFYGTAPKASDVISGSFKYGPLRLVQYAFAEGLIRYMSATGVNVVPSLPTNTVERLLNLESDELTSLSQQEVKDLVDSYKYFLWLFHLSQYNFREYKKEKTVIPNKAETKERLRSLLEILNNKCIFKLD